MKKYYVHKDPQHNGDHEVHREDCRYVPLPQNRIYVGIFTNCADAMKEAQKIHIRVDGCKTCSPECHKH